MNVLTRYLLRAHVGPFLFAFVALTGVILINTLAKSMAELVGKGLPTDVVLEFFVLSLPANIALTLPMSMLVAVLFTFSQMATENEITALKASGIDMKRIVLPLLLVAGVIAVGMVWFNDRVLPESNYRWRMLMVDVAQTSPLLALQEQTINPIQTADGQSRYFLRAGQIDAAASTLEDVTIYDVSAPGVSRTIYADSGRMALNQNRTDLVLTLFDGHMRELNFDEPGTFQQMAFQQQVMRMTGISQRLERSESSSYRTDRDMTIAMMHGRIDTLRTELAEAQAMSKAVLPPSTGGAVGNQSRIDNLQFQIREYQVEVQKKFSIAAATLVFVLLGVPLALRFPRGGIGMVIAASLAVFAIYYVGLIGGETLANEGYVPPVWAMWMTNILFGALGLFGISRLGREQGTDRSSGWDELLGRLRFRRPRGRRVEA